MQRTELPQRNKILEKAHLHTGEPVWIVRSGKSDWRVTSIPLSTGKIHYGDIVQLKINADGSQVVDVVQHHAGFSAALIVEHEAGTIPNDFISKLEGLIPWERIAKDKIAMTMTEDTWKKACGLVDEFQLRAFRLAKI